MCERLTYEGDALHHKRSIRNVVRVEVSPEPVLLIGVGLYTGNEEELFDPDAHITFDRTTTTVNIWCCVPNDIGKELANLVATKSITMNTEEAKIIAKQKVQNKIPTAQTQCPYTHEKNRNITDQTFNSSSLPYQLRKYDTHTH